MYKWFNHNFLFFFAFVMLLTPKVLQAQFFLYNEAPIDIETHFTRHSIEASAQQTFFNVLKIKNNANRSESFTLNITVPQGWNVIGKDKMEMQLAPYDSIVIPLRVSIGSKVRGDIGYSVIASLTDSRGNTIKNEYCFVKIPRKVDLKIKILNRIAYIDPVSGSSEFSLLVSNKGNREEPINFNFDGKNLLGVGKLNQSKFAQDVVVKPYSDSIFSFTVDLKSNESLGRTSYGLNSSISTVDTTFQSTIWFRRLKSELTNQINYKDKPLVVEVVGQGLLDADRKPVISTILEGRVLFKGETDLYYYYRNLSSRKLENFYKNNRMYIGSNVGKWNIEFGDNYRVIESNMYGRGGYLAYNSKELKTEIIVNKDSRINTYNYGGVVNYYFNPLTYIKAGATYSQNSVSEFESKLGLVGGGFTLQKVHHFYGVLAYNQITRELDGKINHNEFGGEFNYSSSVGRFRNKIRVKYGSPLYYSPQAGRLNFNASVQYTLNQKNRISFVYNESQNNRKNIQGVITASVNESDAREGRIEHLYFATPTIHIYGGPAVENFRWAGLNSFPVNQYFSSVGYKLIMGARIKNSSGTSTISPKAIIARVNVLNNPYESISSSSKSAWFNYQYFSINFRNKYFNILSFYTSGPKSVNDQLSYVYFNKPVRRLQFMPAFDAFVYKDILRAYLGLSYSNDIIAGSSYSNITGQVYWYLPQNWRIHALTVYAIQSRKTPQDLTEKYQNLYLEAGLRKEFDFNQPRVKFYDVELVFFKDFNGNNTKNDNEPGVKNVLVSISKVSSEVVGKVPGEFYTAELLSDNFGRVFLEKIPEGLYSISYNPIGKDAGSFSKAMGDVEIKIDRSGAYYFPFVEKNKVFGKIILNRSRLSGMGKIDLSNVRVTAIDSQGRSYSTLTDKEGSFVLFAPVTDEYILTINNIYYENFDLRQNNFRVQFNGYKQFEVNYVFDEKVRRINFAAAPGGEVVGGVMQVRRTTLSGSVKDANTQNPVRARVNLINTKNNVVAVSTYSSATTGEYTLSFVAGDSYLIEVLADDYWYMSENLSLNQITTFMSINREVLLKPISVGSKVELNIGFAPNSSDLSPEAVAEINRLIRQLRNNPSVRLQVQGHCDDLEALQKSSVALDRANAVIKLLIENGFSNVEARSLGNTVPLVANDTEEGRSRNRRVEVEVISK